MRVIWDSESGAPQDCDADGLSDTLEGVLGTAPCRADTDDDGLIDRHEVFGAYVGDESLLRFPRYGADPLVKDVFVELDWNICRKEGVSDRHCDVSGVYTPDLFRSGPDVAPTVSRSFVGTPVRVHVDDGIDRRDSVEGGDWGGADRWDDPDALVPEHYCDSLSDDRRGYFHAGITVSNGGDGKTKGLCFVASTEWANITHELGHTFGLTHDGATSGGLRVNCKPNYLSIMNYRYSGVIAESLYPRFSTGGLPSLDPRGVSESIDLDPLEAYGTSGLLNLGFPVNVVNGHFDWNRDGVDASAPVRAPLASGAMSCGAPSYGAELTAVPMTSAALAVTSGSSPSMYMVYRDAQGMVRERRTTCPACASPWNPPMTQSGRLVAAPSPWASAAHDAPTVFSSYGRLIAVFSDAGHAQWSELRGGNWTPARVVSQADAFGDVSSFSNLQSSFFLASRSDGTLMRHDFSPFASSPWSRGVVQKFEDGTPIHARAGVALAEGRAHFGRSVRTVLLGLIPVAPDGTIAVVYSSRPNVWTRLGGFVGRTAHTPAVAFLSDATVRDGGRFYYAWTPLQEGGDQPPMIGFTPGYVDLTTPTSPVGQTHLFNKWQWIDGDLALLAPSALSVNMVGAAGTHDADDGGMLTYGSAFLPYADGILPGVMYDDDDQANLARWAACSLTQSCPIP